MSQEAAIADARARLTLARRLGFVDSNVARWFGVTLASEVRYVSAPPTAPRRGVGALIALFVAGEALDAAALDAALGAGACDAFAGAELLERRGEQVRARVALLPVGEIVVVCDRLDDRGPEATGAPDLSALNLAAALPRARGLSALDVGCGAGVAALTLAAGGASVVGGDVDARALGYARLGAQLNGVTARFVDSDLFAAVPGERFDLVTFNAPLLRAPLAASDPHAPPRYAVSPRGEALALEFFDGLGAVLRPGGEALLHTQLTARVSHALDAWAARAAVVVARFAAAVDGTAHALVSIRGALAPERRDAWVPLSPVCAQLRRLILDGLHAPRALRDDATPRPAPWLELRASRSFSVAPFSALSFGGLPITDAEVALLERLSGAALGTLALDDADRARLVALVARGHVVLE